MRLAPRPRADAGPAITRYDFTSGALRGTHFTLYATCLTHRGESHLETLPLAGSERAYQVRGLYPGLLVFSEAVCERLMSLKR